MNLAREFIHDSYASYRRKRSIRNADRGPRNERCLLIAAYVWVGFLGLSIVAVVMLIITLNFIAAVIAAAVLAPILVVWYRFMIWYEDKHINGSPQGAKADEDSLDMEPTDW